jgi:hypothetical protein
MQITTIGLEAKLAPPQIRPPPFFQIRPLGVALGQYFAAHRKVLFGNMRVRLPEVGSGSKAVLTVPKTDFRSCLNNGHQTSGLGRSRPVKDSVRERAKSKLPSHRSA